MNMSDSVFFQYSRHSVCVHCMREVFFNKGIDESCVQFQIVLGMASKIKTKQQDATVNYNKDSIFEACNFAKKRLQHRYHRVCLKLKPQVKRH